MSSQQPMSIEDRVRTATRAGADLVRDIGPLQAEAEQARSRRRRGRPLRRWLSWGIPLAAAAAVVIVAVTLVVVRGTPSGTTAVDRTVTPTKTAAPAPQPASTPVPRYYAAVDQEQHTVIVGDDLTGTTIATISPPSGTAFLSVGGAADDRTFVVIAGSAHDFVPSAWYLLRIDPGAARPYQLATVPIKLAGGGNADVLAYALSPDDRELAVESQQNLKNGGAAVTTLAIYSTSSGAQLRAWTTGAYSQYYGYPDTLTWLDGGRELGFSHIPPGSHVRSSGNGAYQNQVRTIDPTGHGTDLIAASHVVLTMPEPSSNPSTCFTLTLTPDGGTVICGTQYDDSAGGAAVAKGCASGGLAFIAYSARTGQPVRALYKYRGPCDSGESAALWTNSSAHDVIAAIALNVDGPPGEPGSLLGVITDGHFRPVRLPAGISAPNNLNIAF